MPTEISVTLDFFISTDCIRETLISGVSAIRYEDKLGVTNNQSTVKCRKGLEQYGTGVAVTEIG
jgi:hypothetical protein